MSNSPVMGSGFVGAALCGALLFGGPQSASGQASAVDGCMEDLAQFGLNCTANDVQLARAFDIAILDDGCAYPGDTVTFEAAFEVVLTAQARHDIGLYFAIDGDPDGNGAVLGTCSVSTVAFAPDPPWLDLDGTDDGGFCANDGSIACDSNRDCKSVGGACAFTQDLCGDIDSAHNPLFPLIQITTECIDPDGNGKLNLPNCTSWRQPGANDLCLTPSDAFPGAPSKCRCDLGFEVDIDVPPASLAVTKNAAPTSIDEPGSLVSFAVTVLNESPFATVELDTLVDDIFGDVTQIQGAIDSTNCTVPHTLGPGGSYACNFVADVAGGGGSVHVDVILASGIDENDNEVSGFDDATVTINDLAPSLSLVKTAEPTEVLEPGGQVLFRVRVVNTSAVDPVTLHELVDDVHGNLNGQGNCAIPQTLQPGGTYLCAFWADVLGNAGDLEVDVVTAEGTDDEGNPVMASDSATVNINDVPSSVNLTKVASPTSLDEPSGVVTFHFTIANTSGVDTITIDTLVDSIYGDLSGLGTCSVPQVLSPGASYFCSVTTTVVGNAFDTETNVATASGFDDDGVPVSDDDDATVAFDNVPPAATLTKIPMVALVTYEVTVRNDSSAEALTLQALVDDAFGDVADPGNPALVATTCEVPTILAPKGQAGDAYSCSFDAEVVTSPHANTVTGTVTDDEGGFVTPSASAEVTLSP